jgi:low affinity Fe/Cu permease
MNARESFRKLAHRTSELVGTPGAFMLAFTTIVVWLGSGPVFRYSDTWQLVINTATTIITFLMVFLIQNAQNRDARAIHLKLDELIRSMKTARNELVDIEAASDEELARIQKEFKELHDRLGQRLARRRKATGAEEPKKEPSSGGESAGPRDRRSLRSQ